MTPSTRLIVLFTLVLALFAVPARADDLADARTLIGKQVELIKAGDLAKLKATFTSRLADRITEAQVKKAASEAAGHPLAELVVSVEAGKDTIKIKMKGGRTLTTLVKVGGAWLADTIWFK